MSDVEDPVELMLKKTGCINLHYKVQACPLLNKNGHETLTKNTFLAGVYCTNWRLAQLPGSGARVQSVYAILH
jgi:hypothetical protein